MINDILEKKIETSMGVLTTAAEMSQMYYKKPLIITYSGGKDSDTVLQLARECLRPDQFEVFNSHTTVDAPETVYYIRERFEELRSEGIKCTVSYPHYPDGRPKSMWSMIVDKQIPPTRFARYCCRELKEASTPNRFIATGVRESESTGRRNRDVFASRGRSKDEALFFSIDHVNEVLEESLEKSGGGQKKMPGIVYLSRKQSGMKI